MCGIIGAIGTDRSDFTETDLAFLHHRGPDAWASTTLMLDNERCALGFKRLRIIDLSPQGDQPLGNEDGSVWIIYNGEIYNHVELRRRLESSGHTFRSKTDTEVIVHLYEELNGDILATLRELRGMFAFALVDQKRGTLSLARDRLGIKPLYFKREGRGLIFSSEVRPLAHLCDSSEISHHALADFLVWGIIRGPGSIIEGVEELMPGHVLQYVTGKIDIKKWWEPSFEPLPLQPGEAEARVAEALEDSISRHLVADRPVGVFLSSGLDSSAVTGIAAKLASIRALTVTFPDIGGDEGYQAARLASRVGAEHQAVPVEGREVSDNFEEILRAMDQPTADGVNSWIVSQAARKSGLVVALSGVGGDELFGGYPSFALVPRIARLQRGLRVLPYPARAATAKLAGRVSPGGKLSRVLPGDGSYTDAYRAVRGIFPPGAFGGIPYWEVARPALNKHPSDRVSSLEMTHYLANHLLRDTDQMSMAHSLEVRVPLLDDRVVEMATSIPADIRMAEGKALLARATGLEPSLFKRGFTLPFDVWLRGPLSGVLREGLLSAELPFGDLIEERMRRRLLSAFEAGRIHWSRPWAVAVLRLWPVANGLSA